jgi:hypothetical protein
MSLWPSVPLAALLVGCIAALPPALETPAKTAAPVNSGAGGFSGRWRVSAPGACTMRGELWIEGSTVKGKLADISATYDIEGVLEDGNLVKAVSTRQQAVSRIEGRFPDGLRVGGGPHPGQVANGTCFGVYLTLEKIE